MELHFKESSRIDESSLQIAAQKLTEYREYLGQIMSQNHYDVPEASINLSIDRQLTALVKEAQKKHASPALKYIVVIGIGGSNLGTKAVYDAIYGFTDHIDGKRFPRIIFLETVDPEYLRRLKNFL